VTAPAATRQSTAPPERVLRRLFLILFLRGRTTRGIDQLKQKGLPTSIGKRLGLTLGFYALFGCVAFMMVGQPVFALATYLHAMTFVLLGMYVATSAGEVLFNREEADILLHRPITPRALLRARIAMLVHVSLWIAGAFNLAGLFAGMGARDGGPLFALVHIVSTTLAAIFTTATVVVTYQLCLRWFGREKLDALMTATQVVVAIAVVLGGQLVPQVMLRVDGFELVLMDRWWTILLPPAWFAGIDDALAGSGTPAAWRLASLGVLATAIVMWLALSRLARDYQAGLQAIAESPVRRTVRPRRRRPHRPARDGAAAELVAARFGVARRLSAVSDIPLARPRHQAPGLPRYCTSPGASPGCSCCQAAGAASCRAASHSVPLTWRSCP
jgi:hypothetical protein